MKRTLMSMAIVAVMFAAASCSCCNNSEKAVSEPAATENCSECTKAEGCCNKAEGCEETQGCCSEEKCADCDSTASDCCKK